MVVYSMAYSMAPCVDLLGQSVQQSTPPPFFSSSSGGHRHSIQDATSSTPSVLIRWILTVLQVNAKYSGTSAQGFDNNPKCSGSSSQGFDIDPITAWGRAPSKRRPMLKTGSFMTCLNEQLLSEIPQRTVSTAACRQVHVLL